MATLADRIASLCSVIDKGKDAARAIAASRAKLPELSAAAERCSDELTGYLADVRRQVRTAALGKTVSLFGAFSTGKTTLLNGLARTSLKGGGLPELPVADDPTTALPVRIRHDETLEPGVAKGRIVLLDGSERDAPLRDALKLMGAGTSSVADVKEIGEIQILVCEPFLTEFDLLDLPGLRAAFYTNHQKIVHSRLRDSACIVWLHGGPEELHPERREVSLIRELVEGTGRQVIPVWNAFQDNSAPPTESERARATDGRDRLAQEIAGLSEHEPLVLWCHQAASSTNSDLAEITGYRAFLGSLEEVVAGVRSPAETAEQALNELALKSIDTLKRLRGNLHEAHEQKVEEGRDVERALWDLDQTLETADDIVVAHAKDAAGEVCETRIEPALRDFVEQETNLGGVVANLWNAVQESGSLKPTTLKQTLRDTLQARLENTLGLQGKNGWIDTFLAEQVQDCFNKLRRTWREFALKLETKTRRHLDLHAPLLKGTTSPDADSMVTATVNEIGSRLGSMLVTLVLGVTSIMMAGATPKSFTPLDILGVLGALAAGGMLLRNLKSRMLGQIGAASWEIGLELRRAIREALKKKNEETHREFANLFDEDGVRAEADALLQESAAIRGVISELQGVDFRGA